MQHEKERELRLVNRKISKLKASNQAMKKGIDGNLNGNEIADMEN
jgi:hypothetical protein